MGVESSPGTEAPSPDGSEALVSAWYRMQVQNAHLLQHLAVEHELNPIDLRALKFLGADDSPQTPKDLAAFLETGSGLVSALIDRLEGQHLIRREPNPRDRRSTLLHLEPQGHQIVDQLRGLYREALSGLMGHADLGAIVLATQEIEQGLRSAAE